MKSIGKSTFSGGVHPSERKSLTENCPIKPGPLPAQVAIMLSQHIGAICEPLVKKGDLVTAGQLIGTSQSFVSASVHSPVNGKVREIALRCHSVTGRSPAIIIDVEEDFSGRTEPFQLSDNFDISHYSGEQICQAVSDAGLVGMGGAGFPTRVKIEPNPSMPKSTMIVNGCECEPYITCDYRLMLERGRMIVAGIKLAKKASQCKRVFIGIEDNKPDAIDAINKILAQTSDCENISVTVLKTKYPQGGERQLINSVLKKHVPTGTIPPVIGVLVINVATCLGIAEAVINKQPLTHRVVTVSGRSIANCGNFYVPLGTTVSQLIDFCGGVTEKAARVIMGGPMMGSSIADLETPITKISGAITVLASKQICRSKSQLIETACIRCGRCLDVCPENLDPTKLAHAVKYNALDLAKDYYIDACMECGCCSYICPANIDITGHIKTGKMHLARLQKQK